MFFFLSLSLFLILFFCLSLSDLVFLCLSLYYSLSLLLIHPFSLFVCLCFCLSVPLSVCLSLYICLCFCLSLHLYESFFIYFPNGKVEREKDLTSVIQEMKQREKTCTSLHFFNGVTIRYLYSRAITTVLCGEMFVICGSEELRNSLTKEFRS